MRVNLRERTPWGTCTLRLTTQTGAVPTHRYDIIPPVVDSKQLRRNDLEHPLPLLLRQRLVAAQRRHDVLHGISVVPVGQLREHAGAGVEPGVVRGDDAHLLPVRKHICFVFVARNTVLLPWLRFQRKRR